MQAAKHNVLHGIDRSDVQAGVALGSLFGWILSFPLFGPFLLRGAGEEAPFLGLLFLFSHGAGLLTLHLLRPAAGLSRTGVKLSGVLLALITLLFPGLASATGGFAPGLQWTAIVLMGGLAAYLVLAWTPLLVGSKSALTALALAMALANLIASTANLPWADPGRIGWELLALAPVLAVYLLATRHGTAEFPLAPADDRPESLMEAVLPLAAFALADYFVGGIWYRAAVGGSPTLGVWWPAVEALLSSGGVLLFYLRVRRASVALLVRYALTLLGLGLLLAAAGPVTPLLVIAYRSLLLMGLVAGDLFYWHQLWRLGRQVGVRRALGLGLGGSLWLIGVANLVSSTGTAELPPSPLFLLVGAAVLFAVIPFVFRQPLARTAAEAAVAPFGAPARVDLAAPEGLTATEAAVYRLLVSGATDQEIAGQLFVSKHTVKFHVRNILRKAGVANRRELLSSLLAGETRRQTGRSPAE